jgi:hypothetical protein
MLAAAIGALALALPGAAAAPERPPIAWNAIPYPARRRAEMAAYARRHYGIATWRLRRPRVIVQHMTQNDSFRATWNTFAPDRPDGELGELPGVCAHFVIDGAGRIHQLVPLGLMCRHTVGLNWTAIGIEHVGNRESQVLGNPRVRRASLRLTAWLRCRYGIAVRDVIGHNENTRSRWHRERVARLRSQTHDDWPRSAMTRYRRGLRAYPCA